MKLRGKLQNTSSSNVEREKRRLANRGETINTLCAKKPFMRGFWQTLSLLKKQIIEVFAKCYYPFMSCCCVSLAR